MCEKEVQWAVKVSRAKRLKLGENVVGESREGVFSRRDGIRNRRPGPAAHVRTKFLPVTTSMIKHTPLFITPPATWPGSVHTLGQSSLSHPFVIAHPATCLGSVHTPWQSLIPPPSSRGSHAPMHGAHHLGPGML